METVRLKNNSEESKILVMSTMITLSQLFSENPLAFYELVQICNNPSHEIFSPVQREALESAGLISQNIVHASIRNIVLSAVEGEGMGMTIGNPVIPKSA